LSSRKVALVVEYDGAGFHGFQRQRNAPTIQGAIEEAIEALTGERTTVTGAGRTDTGVHAKGQVVSFKTSSELPIPKLIRALNHFLAPDVAFRFGYEVDSGFNARRDALRREYWYSILNSQTPSPLLRRQSYFVSQRLDVVAMSAASACLIGQHDFASFTTSMEKSTVRDVYRADIVHWGDLTIFRVVANAFLHKQVRCTVGALVRVGLGKLPVDSLQKMLQSPQPGLAWPAAPAHGLCLVLVEYADWKSGRGLIDEDP
jgi:tRNA pseudouridine38-40 synthase